MRKHNYKLYEPQEKTSATVVSWTFIIFSVIIVLVTYFCFVPFTDKDLTEPLPENKNPKEVGLVTMEMDFSTIYQALAGDRCTWADVNRPKGIFYHPIHLTPTDKSEEALARYSACIPQSLAEATARRYPHLFKYDNEKKEFTLIVTDPKKQFIVVPAWLVANMIESGALILPQQ